ncbi:hypothetical protein LQG66_04030 [Bradyrhizobium ontarionense]|uniref:Uncharacterized protein n=1 Tax=Bradyrhizobium ontarionense TaxID=2898149 RepID=A0ABY3RDZ3_9BRAD|nr:hypothetical protein [Bradyrhizobium sp. A19]UFZ05496.1 hypothetical protein LQG66_04030 [Bradyrhizobium sp. A19]
MDGFGHASRMGKWDQGLGAVGLIGLAVSLTVLVTLGAPYVASHTTQEMKDWGGAIVNVLAPSVTLWAAYIAYSSVQEQIRAQRDGSLLQVLSREQERLEEELLGLRVCMELIAEAFAAGVQPQHHDVLAGKLHELGLSSNETDIASAIQRKVGTKVPPTLLHPVAECLRAYHDSVVEAQNLHYGPPPSQDKKERTLAHMAKRHQDLTNMRWELNSREIRIASGLLPACRNQIEQIVSRLHD